MLKPRPTYEQYIKVIRAHNLTTARIRRKLIKKPKRCEGCNKKANNTIISAHHPNYDKPYVIQWLCPKCHGGKRDDNKYSKDFC